MRNFFSMFRYFNVVHVFIKKIKRHSSKPGFLQKLELGDIDRRLMFCSWVGQVT